MTVPADADVGVDRMDNDSQQKFWTVDAGPTWVARMKAMDLTLRPVLDEVLRLAAIQSGVRIIDIGCGAGTSTLQAAAQTGISGTALGVDISQTLLEAARSRAQGQQNLAFLLADAQTHPFKAKSCDCMISRFGVMFFADPPAAFANMARALSPGGRMVFATWGAISENPYFTLPAQIAAEVIGRPPKADPDAPGPLSLRETSLVEALLEKAGLTDITAVETPMMLTPTGGVEDVAELLCDIGSAQRVLLHFNATKADRARLATALAGPLCQYETAKGIRIPALINMFSARKPA